MNRKIKKIYFELISNTKIIYKILLNEVANYQDFGKLTGRFDKGRGTRQKRTWQRRIQ